MAGQGTVFVVGVLTVWVALSATLIIFNAALLGSFRHPILLTCWHQFVSVVLIVVIRAAVPSLVSTGDPEKGLSPLSFRSALSLGMPVAVCQSIGLVAGNTAIMYMSVAFCQMIKAFTPACVYASGCLMGTQQWSTAIAKSLAVITFGLMVTSAGEMHFHLLGFVAQVVALVTEGLRITLLELRLKAQGYRLNALSSVMVFAPMVCALLFIAALIFDRSAFDMQQINEIGVGIFSANAIVAFLLNVAIYMAIQSASGLIFTLAGILKDIMIVTGGCLFQGTPITTTQMIGYTIAMFGLQLYGVVSRNPSDFDNGIVPELVRRAMGAEKSDGEVGAYGALEKNAKDLLLSISTTAAAYTSKQVSETSSSDGETSEGGSQTSST
jgi:hypothetical protein